MSSENQGAGFFTGTIDAVRGIFRQQHSLPLLPNEDRRVPGNRVEIWSEKKPGAGEDAEPVYVEIRDSPDRVLIGVLDGMGGAGARRYQKSANSGPDDPGVTGARLGARLAAAALREWALELPIEPVVGTPAFESELVRLRTTLEDHLSRARIEHPPLDTSGLKSNLRREFPTTLAGLVVEWRGADTVAVQALSAGDSRAYVLSAAGLQQLTKDDIPEDATGSAAGDARLTNAISGDRPFEIHSPPSLCLPVPCLLLVATDGAFGYFPTPIHFERAILSTLKDSDSWEEWSQRLDQQIQGVTGDDAALILIPVGERSLPDIRRWLKGRLVALDRMLEPSSQLEGLLAQETTKLSHLRAAASQQEESVRKIALEVQQAHDRALGSYDSSYAAWLKLVAKGAKDGA